MNGACTTFRDTIRGIRVLTPVKADLLVPGCATTPLSLRESTAPLDLIEQLTVTDGATVDYSNAKFVVTASNEPLWPAPI